MPEPPQPVEGVEMRPAQEEAPAEADVVEEIDKELDQLRDQLDSAFEEVVNKVNRVDLRLGAIRHGTEVQGEAIKAIEELVIRIAADVQAIKDRLPPA